MDMADPSNCTYDFEMPQVGLGAPGLEKYPLEVFAGKRLAQATLDVFATFQPLAPLFSGITMSGRRCHLSMTLRDLALGVG